MPEKTVVFAFELDEKVRTPFGDDGIIYMCALDDVGKIYFVKTSKDDKWFKENQLSKP